MKRRCCGGCHCFGSGIWVDVCLASILDPYASPLFAALRCIPPKATAKASIIAWCQWNGIAHPFNRVELIVGALAIKNVSLGKRNKVRQAKVPSQTSVPCLPVKSRHNLTHAGLSHVGSVQKSLNKVAYLSSQHNPSLLQWSLP